MARPALRFGIPVVLIALLSASLFLLFPAQSALAFDDLIKPLLTAQTARCKVVVQMKDQSAFTFDAMFRGTVSRQDSKDTGSVTIQDAAKGTSLTLIPKLKKAMIFQAVNRDPDQTESGGFLQSVRDQLLGLQQDKQVTRVSLGERTVAERKLIGYRINSPAMQLEIWGDQETGMPHTFICTMAALPNSIS